MEIESPSDTRDDRNSNDEREILSDEAEEESSARRDVDSGSEETKRRIDPSAARHVDNRRVRPKLDAARLRGPKGLHTVETYFKGFKFPGKGQEKLYLKGLLKRLEYWAHRIFPKYLFDDFLEKIEIVGTKKETQVLIRQCRLGMVTTDQDVRESADEEENKHEDVEVEPIDAFDALINNEKSNHTAERTEENIAASVEMAKTPTMTDEVKAKIEANRKAAIERKLARERERSEKSKNERVTEVQPENHPTVSNITDKGEDAAWANEKQQEMDNPWEHPSMATPQFQLPKDNTKNQLECNKPTAKLNEYFSPVDSKSNALSHVEEIIEETEEQSEDDPSKFTEMMETSPAKETTVETPHMMECSYSPRDSRQALEKASDNSERLLTHEELLEAIDGAMEEIIGKETTIRL